MTWSINYHALIIQSSRSETTYITGVVISL